MTALAGVAFAAALVAGCGGGDEDDPPVTETAQEDAGADDQDDADSDYQDDAELDEPTADDGSDEESGQESDETPDESSDDGSDEATADAPDGESDENSGSGENLFEGTWGFGHDAKTLSAQELSDLLEDEADARGPAELTVSVECGDGIDTSTQDDDAECIAYADEGVEHLWAVTGGPADAGLEITVENLG